MFSGTLDHDGFVDFAAHRARRLDLDLRLETASARFVAMTVAGEPDLIDAFEMACSLGPATCIVREVARDRLPSTTEEP